MNKPDAVNDKQTVVLEKIVQEFPYFQSARALYLKGLYNQNSFKYNYVLKVTAAHTTDRSILFDFITSDKFTSVNKALFEQKLSQISDITVTESEIVAPKLEARENTVEQSILSLIKEAAPKELAPEPAIEQPVEIINVPEIIFERVSETTEEADKPDSDAIVPNFDDAEAGNDIPAEVASEFQPTAAASPMEDKLELGKPLEFAASEKHSFQEWLQLSKFKPINREAPAESTANEAADSEIAAEQNNDEAIPETDFGKQKKNELINRFIQTNPKIPPVKHNAPLPPSILVEPSNADNSYLMTETLARVYLEQKKYHKAIQAYQILILKYPEKSSFFADRILDIKNLQQNNKQ